jgi:hypothetical protein
LIHMLRVGAGGRVLPQNGEVGGYLTIEQGHLLQFGAGKLTQPAAIGLGQEGRQPVPVGPSLENPLV